MFSYLPKEVLNPKLTCLAILKETPIQIEKSTSETPRDSVRESEANENWRKYSISQAQIRR